LIHFYKRFESNFGYIPSTPTMARSVTV